MSLEETTDEHEIQNGGMQWENSKTPGGMWMGGGIDRPESTAKALRPKPCRKGKGASRYQTTLSIPYLSRGTSLPF